MIVITSILVLGALGFIFAALLALAADYFKIEINPRVETILAVLPGANCGACGAAGCHAFAEKVSKGEIAVSGCVVGGEEVARKIAEIMGTQGFVARKQVAAVHCGAKKNQRKMKANYYGVQTCKAADIIEGGALLCTYGCLGYGDCFCVCPFDAIRMEEGLPIINAEKCTACGKCVEACPRKIISLRPYKHNVVVACSSRDSGAETRKICPVGCIACKICEREAPEIFRIVDNLAIMDYSKEDMNCGQAVEKCPTRCIIRTGGN